MDTCIVSSSVADPGCLSRIPDPDFYPYRIPDLGFRIQKHTKERGEKFFFIKHFFVATNFTKCKIILFLNCSRKKFRPNFKELRNFIPKKLSQSSQKYEFGIRDPGSGIRNKPIPDPGSRIQGLKKAPDPGSGSATLVSSIPYDVLVPVLEKPRVRMSNVVFSIASYFFPGVSHTECRQSWTDPKPWCPVKVNEDGSYISGDQSAWGYCQPCPQAAGGQQ